MTDNIASIDCNEREIRPRSVAESVDEVGLVRLTECGFIHAAYRGNVIGLLGSDLHRQEGTANDKAKPRPRRSGDRRFERLVGRLSGVALAL